MLSKSEIQFVRSLHQKKFRQEEQLFLVEGTKIVNELLHASYPIKRIYAVHEWISKHPEAEIFSQEISQLELEKISCLNTPNEVIALAEIPQSEPDMTLLKNKITLLVDTIQDPGNLGTIIRLADWFGIETILCSQETVELYNPKVIQSTMGSFIRTKVYYGNLLEAIDFAKSNAVPIYAAALHGANIYSENLEKNAWIVLGNESKGISAELIDMADHLISIPSFGEKKADSLNVSIAAAIICSEFKRRIQ
jgi:TrmH family RNA methyltransferase